MLTYAIQSGANGPGVILAVLKIRTLIETLIAPSEAILSVQLTDLRDNYWIFNNFELANNSPPFETEFTFGTRKYLLRTQPTRLYLVMHRGFESWAVLVVGVLATGLLGALLLFGSGHAHRIQQLVDERTFDLQVSNQRLSAEMVERNARKRHCSKLDTWKRLGS